MLVLPIDARTGQWPAPFNPFAQDYAMGLHVFFDFDGTLVDSAPGILRGYELVLQTSGLSPVVDVGTHLIGPPLAQTLSEITGVTDAARLQQLVECFKQAYDSEGYKETIVYPHVAQALAQLRADGHQPVLLTNKRRIPTLKILEHFRLEEFFSAVYTPDSWQPAVKRKNDTMQRALAELQLAPARCVMVGDSSDDAHAAADHSIPFIAVSWGYGDGARQHEFARLAVVDDIAQLPGLLRRLAS